MYDRLVELVEHTNRGSRQPIPHLKHTRYCLKCAPASVPVPEDGSRDHPPDLLVADCLGEGGIPDLGSIGIQRHTTFDGMPQFLEDSLCYFVAGLVSTQDLISNESSDPKNSGQSIKETVWVHNFFLKNLDSLRYTTSSRLTHRLLYIVKDVVQRTSGDAPKLLTLCRLDSSPLHGD